MTENQWSLDGFRFDLFLTEVDKWNGFLGLMCYRELFVLLDRNRCGVWVQCSTWEEGRMGVRFLADRWVKSSTICVPAVVERYGLKKKEERKLDIHWLFIIAVFKEGTRLSVLQG